MYRKYELATIGLQEGDEEAIRMFGPLNESKAWVELSSRRRPLVTTEEEEDRILYEDDDDGDQPEEEGMNDDDDDDDRKDQEEDAPPGLVGTRSPKKNPNNSPGKSKQSINIPQAQETDQKKKPAKKRKDHGGQNIEKQEKQGRQKNGGNVFPAKYRPMAARTSDEEHEQLFKFVSLAENTEDNGAKKAREGKKEGTHGNADEILSSDGEYDMSWPGCHDEVPSDVVAEDKLVRNVLQDDRIVENPNPGVFLAIFCLFFVIFFVFLCLWYEWEECFCMCVCSYVHTYTCGLYTRAYSGEKCVHCFQGITRASCLAHAITYMYMYINVCRWDLYALKSVQKKSHTLHACSKLHMYV